jgi:hypothetical protein
MGIFFPDRAIRELQEAPKKPKDSKKLQAIHPLAQGLLCVFRH